MNSILLLENIVFILSLISTAAVLCITIFSISSLTKQPQLKIIGLIILISFLADSLFAVGDYLLNIYIPYIGVTYRLLELIILLEFYNRIFSYKWNTYLVRALQLGLPLFFLFIINYESTPIRITNSFLFSTYAIFYFRKLILELKMDNPLDFPLFWINAAILLYFSGSVFIFLFFDPLAKLHEMSAVVSYMFHNIFLITKNVLFAIGFWKVRKLATIQLIPSDGK